MALELDRFSFQFLLWELPLKKKKKKETLKLIPKRIYDCAFPATGVWSVTAWVMDFSPHLFMLVAVITLSSLLLFLFYDSVPCAYVK